MKKINSNIGLSLVELILASVLVIIVIVGIVAINFALSNNNQDYGQRYLLKSETQATLNNILYNASLAIGSLGDVGIGTIASPYVADQAVLVGTQMGGSNTVNPSFCIHQQQSISTPPYYNDIWMCYMLDNTTGDVTYGQISYCNKTYTINDSAGFRGASAACVGTYLGNGIGITPIFSSSSPLLFQMNIVNCYNNSATATCSSTGSTDQVNNPSVSLTGSVIPMQSSDQ